MVKQTYRRRHPFLFGASRAQSEDLFNRRALDVPRPTAEVFFINPLTSSAYRMRSCSMPIGGFVSVDEDSAVITGYDLTLSNVSKASCFGSGFRSSSSVTLSRAKGSVIRLPYLSAPTLFCFGNTSMVLSFRRPQVSRTECRAEGTQSACMI